MVKAINMERCEKMFNCFAENLVILGIADSTEFVHARVDEGNIITDSNIKVLFGAFIQGKNQQSATAHVKSAHQTFCPQFVMQHAG